MTIIRFCVRVSQFAFAVCATMSAAIAADALPTGGHAPSTFIPSWDVDGDDKVPRAEYDAARSQRFAATDENKDGALSITEYVDEYAVRLDRQIADERKASLVQTHTRFGSLDGDDDGFISRAEYDASGERIFAKLDEDKDGSVIADAAARQNTRQRSVIAMPSTHDLRGFLEIHDDDGDDVVTRAQYTQQRAAAYVRTDANGDGRLSEAEYTDGRLSEAEYTDEFVQRLQQQIDDSRTAQLKQGKVRFNAIDSDENGAIGRAEYQAMSERMFERADTNRDGVVSSDDPAPARVAREQQPEPLPRP